MPHMPLRGARAHKADDPLFNLVPFGTGRSPNPTKLTAATRDALRAISVSQRLPAGTVLFEQGAPATFLYNILAGAAYCERRLPDGRRRGMAFLFPGDLCGLARAGVYVNTVRLLTATTVLRTPMDALKTVMLRNADVQFHFLCKVVHIVRESQRQLLMLGRKDPVERVAIFVSMIERAQASAGSRAPGVPVTPEQMASYLDLKVPTVNRVLALLESHAIAKYSPKDGFHVISSRKLQRLVDGQPAAETAANTVALPRERSHRMSRTTPASRHAAAVHR